MIKFRVDSAEIDRHVYEASTSVDVALFLLFFYGVIKTPVFDKSVYWEGETLMRYCPTFLGEADL